MPHNVVGKNIKVYENFLTEPELTPFEIIRSKYRSFAWYFSEVISEEYLRFVKDDFINFQFCHTLYSDFSQQSSFFSLCEPILNKLKVKALQRVKFNLTFPTQKPTHLGTYHNDCYRDGKVDTTSTIAVFYPFKNNGKFLVKENDTEYTIDNKANQLIVIPNTLEHLGISNTDNVPRYALNIVYY